MEHLTNTIHQVTEGFTATSEQEILPIYYGTELANGAAFRACQIKHLMQDAGQLAVRTYDTVKHVGAAIDPSVKWTLGMTLGMTAIAVADKFIG